MSEQDLKPTAKWAVGDLVQSKAGGPKMVVDAVTLPTRSALDRIIGNLGDEVEMAMEKASASGIHYWCIYWTGNKRNREQFAEGGLIDWVEPTK